MTKLDPLFIKELHETIKFFINDFDSFEFRFFKTKIGYSFTLCKDNFNYYIEGGFYDAEFYVILDGDDINLFSIGNMPSVHDCMEFYTDENGEVGEFPGSSIQFPEELTPDSFFNASIIHDYSSLTLEFMKDTKVLYDLLHERVQKEL